MESIGAFRGTWPFHISVLVWSGLSAMVRVVPLKLHFSASKSMFTNHVFSAVPVFLNAISTAYYSPGCLSITPFPDGGKASKGSPTLTSAKTTIISSTVNEKNIKRRPLTIFPSPDIFKWQGSIIRFVIYFYKKKPEF